MLIIAALLLYFFVFHNHNTTTDNAIIGSKNSTGMVGNDFINIHENNRTVAAYIAFVKDISNNKTSFNHEFSSDALLKLTDATNAMAGETKYDIKVDLDWAKVAANSITKDSYATSRADSIKSATVTLSTCLVVFSTYTPPFIIDDRSVENNFYNQKEFRSK